MNKDPNYCVERRFTFHAAHRNLAIPGKCQNLHGHSYQVEVAVSAPQNPESGVTVLFDDLEKACAEARNVLDHKTLLWYKDPLVLLFGTYNDMPGQEAPITYEVFEQQTSAEYLAEVIAGLVSDPRWVVTRVRLKETDSSTIIYKP